MLSQNRRFVLCCWLCAALSGLLAVLLMASESRADDWPEFRGPQGQGHAGGANFPLKWDESTNITWKRPVKGIAWSSPVIVKDRIYLTTSTVTKGEGENDKGEVILGAVCLNAKTGEQIWEKTVLQHPTNVQIHKKNSHASPTPIVEGDGLYLHFGSNGTARLTLDGNVVWKRVLDYEPQHGNGGSPALAGDVLIICCDGTDQQYVIGLDKKTGETRWKENRSFTASKGFSFSTPLLITVNGQQQAICPGSGGVIAYEPQTGKEIWKASYGEGYSVIPRPVYGNGLVYVCSGYNKPKLFAIDPTGTGDVTATHIRWETDKQVPHSPSLLLVDKLLFFVSDKGIARCVDAVTGEEHWQQRLGGNFSASPLLLENRVYFQDEQGHTTVIAASPKFEVLAESQLDKDERTFASYAIADNAIFLRSENHLYRIENKGR